METAVNSISVKNTANIVVATAQAGTLFGTRGDYQTLVVKDLNVTTPLKVGTVYSIPMKDGDGDNILGVKLAYGGKLNNQDYFGTKPTA